MHFKKVRMTVKDTLLVPLNNNENIFLHTSYIRHLTRPPGLYEQPEPLGAESFSAQLTKSYPFQIIQHPSHQLNILQTLSTLNS